MGIFDFNEDSPIIVEDFMDSKIYYIDNFFKNPDDIVDFLHDTPGYVHHPSFIPSGMKDRNCIDFLDKRHEFTIDGIDKVNKYLSNICGQKSFYDPHCLMSNMTKFFNTPFNDYENKYWWPHCDDGYNGIIYLNKDDISCGTNLYNLDNLDTTIDEEYEHTHPWRSKKHYSILKSIEPVYNRCVLFDGLKFLHGMNICNDKYFSDIFRLNLAFFYCP